jgi:hypothetical protein
VNLLRRGLRIVAPVAAQIIADELIIQRAAVQRPRSRKHHQNIDFAAIQIGQTGQTKILGALHPERVLDVAELGS